MTYTDFASKGSPVDRNLKRVAVNQFGESLIRNNNIPLIYVTDNVTRRMDSVEHSGQVGSGAYQEAPGRLRKLHLSMSGTIQLMNLLIARDPWHQESDYLSGGS
jgi:hypothetical protein